MSKTPVNISVSDDHLDRFPEVVSELRKAGLQVEQELAAVGIVSGTVEEDQLADVEKVAGVAAVEPEVSYQLPPPESDIQ